MTSSSSSRERSDDSVAATTRLDVLDALKRAAKMSLEYHDTYVALVTGAAVNEDWSEPVRIRMIPKDIGFVEIEVSRV